jgi:hypothetical protein
MENGLTKADPRMEPVRIVIPGRFQVGQRVLVHQSRGLDLSGTVEGGIAAIKVIPHDCSDPSLHWESRSGMVRLSRCPIIATRVGNNPCHAEWPYTADSLTPLDGPDWTEVSTFKAGDKIRFAWPHDEDFHRRVFHHPLGKVLDWTLEAAHIEPGDWYVSTLVPGYRTAGGLDAPPSPFKQVVNERDFFGAKKAIPGRVICLPDGRTNSPLPLLTPPPHQ